jgi:hypothetical protein
LEKIGEVIACIFIACVLCVPLGLFVLRGIGALVLR